MKNKAQFLSFVETIKPRRKTDEKKIVEYCLLKGIPVSFIKDGSNRTLITFDEFIAWAESDTPGVGSIITYETSYSVTIGIISATSPEEIILGVTLIGGDGLITSKLSRPNAGYRDATEEEILRIHHALTNKGFSWNLWRNNFVRSLYIPRKNQFVRFRSYIGKHYGIGVFKEFNDSGNIVMYCLKENDEPVRYSLNEIIGKKEHYQIAPANKSDILLLKEELSLVGKIWNGFHTRIQPINFICDEGQEYCYINDKGKIQWDHNNGSLAYRERVAFGNIFVTAQQAEDFLTKVRELRKLDLCKPQENKDSKKRKYGPSI